MGLLPPSSAHSNPDTSFAPGALVLFENNSEAVLATILRDSKKKLVVLSERGREVELGANRLLPVPGKLPSEHTTNASKAAWLLSTIDAARKSVPELALETLWETAWEEGEKDYTMTTLCELYYGKTSNTKDFLALVLALYQDRIYFKRKKQGFIPRTDQIVEELKRAEEARQERLRQQRRTVEVFKARLADPELEFPQDVLEQVRLLENLAAGVPDFTQQKQAKELLKLCESELNFELRGSLEKQAFWILERLKHFATDQNLSLIRHKPAIEFSPQAIEESQGIDIPGQLEAYRDSATRLDLTDRSAFTIDDSQTQDMDDAISLTPTSTGYELGVYISDVASFVAPDSALDRAARSRSSTIYCPERDVPMFPAELSHNSFSLVTSTPRAAMAYVFDVDQSFNIRSSKIAPALIAVKRKYSYDEVDELLESEDPTLLPLYQIAGQFQVDRLANDALMMPRKDVLISINPDGSVALKEIDEASPARSMIGELMILTNKVSAEYAATHDFPLVFRSQSAPEEELPAEGVAPIMLKPSTHGTQAAPHYALGLEAYAQATSPIRRYFDLCNQRQLLAHLRGEPTPYTAEQLEPLIHELDITLGTVRTIAFESKRYWLLKYLRQRMRDNPEITATVTRIDTKRPVVKLDEVFMTAMTALKGTPKYNDRVRLRLVEVDPRGDYLRLEHVG